jgi:hypothetical protein
VTAVTRRLESIQYDGTNGSFICGTWLDVTLDSDDGEVLVFLDGDQNLTNVPQNYYLIRSRSTDQFPTAIVSPSDYALMWHELVASALTLAAGYALTPSITGSGGTANVAVDLNTSMSGTGYEATAVLAGTSALLADLDITAVAVTDNNTVTVTVQNNGALALAGATVIVTAAELI